MKTRHGSLAVWRRRSVPRQREAREASGTTTTPANSKLVSGFRDERHSIGDARLTRRPAKGIAALLD
jgi:hypothetical protein